MKTLLKYGFALGSILALGTAGDASGQAVAPGDVNNLAHQMAEQVRHLGEDIASDLGAAPQGRHLIQDTQELAQAVDQFHDTLHDRRDPIATRQAYAGIDGTWHHLRGQLSQPGATSPAVDRAARRVDALDAQIHQALGLNDPPPGFYGGAQAPTGIADTRRLAHALVDRAEALSSAIQATMGNDPNAAGPLADANLLARTADAFHDTIDANQPIQVAAQAFGPVDQVADRVERYVTANQVPPAVASAWQSFASVEVLIHQNLGLQSPQPAVQVSLVPTVPGGPSPLLGLADVLLAQSSEVAQIFSTSLGRVPEGGLMLIEAQRLQAASADFRGDVARGLAANQLAFEFRDVDACWQRLVRRVNRVARGQIGPNIAKVQDMGGTCEQIHRVLGMPGYPPTFGGPAFIRTRDILGRDFDERR